LFSDLPNIVFSTDAMTDRNPEAHEHWATKSFHSWAKQPWQRTFWITCDCLGHYLETHKRVAKCECLEVRTLRELIVPRQAGRQAQDFP
jgi:hypothetical protein